MKKTTALVLACLAAIFLCAAPAFAADKHKVFLITMDQMDQHWANMDFGARKAAEEAGNIDYAWMAPDIKDDAKQIEIVNNAVAAGAEVILIAANGPNAVTAALKEANGAGVKIIYVDSPAEFPGLATFATNNKAAGKTAGEVLVKALKDKGVTKGRIGVVSVNAATQSTVDRENGFREAFKGSAFELLPSQYGEGDVARSKDIAANFITQDVVGIFGANEGSTVGVGNAIAEDGNQVLGVGFDNSDSIRGLIRSGALLGAMVQNPDVMGAKGVEAAAAVLGGGYKGEKMVDTGVTVMTKDKL
ncbi:MAG: substrate-binding domain-containing protein [Candidatus Adiutrix sp.]|jgi:ribose transport system substrate-binding protein|nr:substrate-binding domain-containing protein [Candidatus Adiutrix sp.]